MKMIEWSRADTDQAAFVNFKDLAFILIAAKNEVCVLERYSTRIEHFLTIRVEFG